MKKVMVWISTLVLAGGCATGPYTPVSPGVLKGCKIVYFEQADRVPKDVMLEAWKHQPVVVGTPAVLKALPPDAIAAIVKEILAAIPQVTAGYQNERMNETLMSRRMLFIGYEGTNELREIREIVEVMGSSFEYLTPQDGKPEAEVEE